MGKGKGIVEKELLFEIQKVILFVSQKIVYAHRLK
jgi:hypothetical protein